MLITREAVRTLARQVGAAVDFSAVPLQAGMLNDPWRVAVASMLLCRARRAQAAPALKTLLTQWPCAELLARADANDVEAAVRRCGLQRNRARQLIRFSSVYASDAWKLFSELPGVGAYVHDAVAVFCFNHTEVTCGDGVLVDYVESLRSSAQRLQTGHSSS